MFVDLTDLEVPTLLHLAAKYGLTQLASKLVDLPDATSALSLRNAQGRRPSELAQLGQHRRVKDILDKQV